jgi:threonyl-tRNA synthetase
MRCCAVSCPAQAIGVTNVSRAFWRADVTKEPLQRVYAITFPDKAQLKEYQRRE